ncbi:carbohydrate-binding module family 52 protein [Collybiopsis luxurians FD-317 M1]|uniref:Carbohydrate-binding module family 52 protein n=1 Tax=Collybiopsis luxurians FD-317 M1 TaxID=944289 RepID=A0A0D0B1R6_9AGAR|nr:carbohydrate-binding module family 52 protein [Collybiopsis luxurians FD-317 M1]
MAPLVPLVLTGLVAGVVVAQSEELLNCGSSTYFPSQYTCFDGDFLCPVLNGDIYIRCGDACYSTSQYSCSDDTLEPYNPDGPLEDCGTSSFDPSQYVCLDGDFLCPFMDGNATLRCGDACYAPSQYNCTNGQLAPVTAPSCIPNLGQNVICDDEGCTFLQCCPGLISVADHCRDPCELVPSDCPTSTAT